jgi:hypothetical protein
VSQEGGWRQAKGRLGISLTLKKISRSPFDFPGITTKATTEDILAAVRESRSR